MKSTLKAGQTPIAQGKKKIRCQHSPGLPGTIPAHGNRRTQKKGVSHKQLRGKSGEG